MGVSPFLTRVANLFDPHGEAGRRKSGGVGCWDRRQGTGGEGRTEGGAAGMGVWGFRQDGDPKFSRLDFSRDLSMRYRRRIRDGKKGGDTGRAIAGDTGGCPLGTCFPCRRHPKIIFRKQLRMPTGSGIFLMNTLFLLCFHHPQEIGYAL